MTDGASRTPWRGLYVSRAAVRKNVAALLKAANASSAMVELPGNAYGHGLVEAAITVVPAGAGAISVTNADDAIALRESGFTGPVWVTRIATDDSLPALAERGIGVVAGTDSLAIRALDAGIASLGISHGSGMRSASADDVVAIAASISLHPAHNELRSLVVIADSPSHADDAANTLGAHDLAIDAIYVRAGLPLTVDGGFLPVLGAAVFGLSESDEAPAGVVPAARLTAPVLSLKHARAGIGVSYGYTYVTSTSTTLALVPFGYGDGIDRSAGNTVEAQIAGQRFTIAGRVAMDASVFDIQDAAVAIGDEVVFFGSGEGGEPTAQEWAAALSMPSAAIVAGLTDRVNRMWV
ncbi:alanine racemase [Salinibacterium hongtaonis]|uniref:alanine racemase n=1 Tax=Homoserinimonas hongtaonis TaxID=2079791 RepID=UPI000D38FB8B|nr:alanine racemase C-terminal domain-containing protein [Salinibacterium hongtaonis]AWB89331.1 hypothetical protein C2138_07075 [Salinibacterium hongtaonis]